MGYNSCPQFRCQISDAPKTTSYVYVCVCVCVCVCICESSTSSSGSTVILVVRSITTEKQVINWKWYSNKKVMNFKKFIITAFHLHYWKPYQLSCELGKNFSLQQSILRTSNFRMKHELEHMGTTLPFHRNKYWLDVMNGQLNNCIDSGH